MFQLFRGATTDFNTTFGLALAAVLAMQYFGMKEQGVFFSGYLFLFRSNGLSRASEKVLVLEWLLVLVSLLV